jgi:hypothetical protein
VGIVSTPSGHGYWVVDAEGGVFGYGDAAVRRREPVGRAGTAGDGP